MTKYKSSKTQEKHSRGNTADTGIGKNRMCRLAKQKSIKANLSNLYSGRRVTLEKLINDKI